MLSARSRPAGPAAAAALRLGEDDPVYEVRRIRLGDGRPIALERSLFPAARFPGMLEFRLDGSLYDLLEIRYGLRPHRARESLEPVTAGVREAEALDVAEGAPLMQVERTAYARSGEPLEFARDLFRGDRTRVVVWTSELPETSEPRCDEQLSDRGTSGHGAQNCSRSWSAGGGCGEREGLPNGRISCTMDGMESDAWSEVRAR